MNRDPGWFERSSWADQAWRSANERYWEARDKLGRPWRPDKNAYRGSLALAQAMADESLYRARAEYRHQILSWYAKLCLPLKSDESVPNEVAYLQYEQWDLDGCDIGDAVNL